VEPWSDPGLYCFCWSFEGCFGKNVVQNVVFGGEVVVFCVVNVVCWMAVLWGIKIRHQK
jgi:hypothetical protein